MGAEPIRVATRTSELAMAQTMSIVERLETRGYKVEVLECETRGDRIRDELIHRLGRTGAFVRSLDERVIAEEADIAIHSLKDMPTEMPAALIVAAIPERADSADLLITPEGQSVDELPENARVGTASLRRGAQLQAARPDLEIVPIRGNIDTRLEKLLSPHVKRRRAAVEAADDEDLSVEQWEAGLTPIEARSLDRAGETELDGIVLAAAGLKRSGLIGQVETWRLPLATFVPAPGQGALALTMRDTDLAGELHRYLDHPPSRVEVTVERTILGTVGAGCIAPIGVSASVQGDVIATRAQVLAKDGDEVISRTQELPVESYVNAAVSFAEELLDEGAGELIEAATREGSDSEAMRHDDEE